MRIVPRLASLRGRLMALLLLGAVPLAAMGVVVAWQNYRAAATRAEENTLLPEQWASARHRAAIEEVEQVLGAIARTREVLADRVACERLVQDGLLLRGARYVGLAVLDADGQPVCAAVTPMPAGADAPVFATATSEWFREVRQTNGLTVNARLSPRPGGGILIDAAYPMLDGERFVGAAVAALRVDWFGPRWTEPARAFEAWLIDPSGSLIPAAGSLTTALPPTAELRKLLLSSPALLMARARSGHTFYYATADLGGGLRLLVAHDTSGAAAAARDVLFDRIVGLGLLLVFGLAAVAFGANLALVEPLRRLTATVERWRGGGPFDPGKLDELPAELKGLCLAFAQATRALGERERQLRIALGKQELLSREIHHRVKNNLQIVASLLNLQASRIRQPEAKAEFQSARDRVRALATLHRHLYLQGEPQTIGMRGFLEELCGQLLQALGPAAAHRIRLDIQATDLRLSSDQAVPLSLIVTETVGNAIKYAFPGDRSGNISVRLTADGEQVHLVIEDDGIGLPSGRSQTETGVRDGIGIQLVRGLVRQLGATLTVDEGSGTRYEVIIPLQTTSPGGPETESAPREKALG